MERKNPQEFYPFSKREQIINKWKRKQNGLLNTTGMGELKF